MFRTNTMLPFHGINALTHNPCDFNTFFVSCKSLMSVTGHEDVQRIGGTAPYILNFNKQSTSRPGRFAPHSWSDYNSEQWTPADVANMGETRNAHKVLAREISQTEWREQ